MRASTSVAIRRHAKARSAAGSAPSCPTERESPHDAAAPDRRRAKEPPSAYFKRMYHDSVTNWRPALDLARAVVGADHIVLGSDFPYWYRRRLRDCLDVVSGLNWPEGELELVRGGNVARLLSER